MDQNGLQSGLCIDGTNSQLLQSRKEQQERPAEKNNKKNTQLTVEEAAVLSG